MGNQVNTSFKIYFLPIIFYKIYESTDYFDKVQTIKIPDKQGKDAKQILKDLESNFEETTKKIKEELRIKGDTKNLNLFKKMEKDLEDIQKLHPTEP